MLKKLRGDAGLSAGAFTKLRQSVTSQWQRYYGAVSELVRAVVLYAGIRMGVYLALASLGVALVGAGLVMVLHYAQSLEAGTDVNFIVLRLSPRLTSTLFLVASGAGLLLLGGAVLIFFSRSAILAVAMRFKRQQADVIIASYGGLPANKNSWLSNGKLNSDIVRLANADNRKCALAVRRLLNAIVPSLVFIASTVTLFYLDFLATIIIFSILIVASIGHYAVNLMTVRSSKQFEAAQPISKRAFRQLLVGHESWQGSSINLDHEYNHGHRQLILEASRTFEQRFLSAIRSEFVSYLGTAAAFSVLVLYLGQEAIAGRMQWAILIAYLVSMRMALTAFRSVFNALTMVSRYYPSIYRWQNYLRGTRSQKSNPIRRISISVAPSYLSDYNSDSVRLHAGQVALLSSSIIPTRYSAFYYASILGVDRSRSRKIEILNAISTFSVIGKAAAVSSIGEMLGLPAHFDATHVRAAIGRDAQELEKRISLDPTATVIPENWQALTLQDRINICRAGIILTGRDVVVMQQSLFDEAWMQEHADWCKERLVIVARGMEPPAAEEFQPNYPHLVGTPERSLVALCSNGWATENWGMIRERWDAVTDRVTGDIGEDAEAVLDDDEEED